MKSILLMCSSCFHVVCRGSFAVCRKGLRTTPNAKRITKGFAASGGSPFIQKEPTWIIYFTSCLSLP